MSSKTQKPLTKPLDEAPVGELFPLPEIEKRGYGINRQTIYYTEATRPGLRLKSIKLPGKGKNSKRLTTDRWVREFLVEVNKIGQAQDEKRQATTKRRREAIARAQAEA